MKMANSTRKISDEDTNLAFTLREISATRNESVSPESIQKGVMTIFYYTRTYISKL